jgi:outer membrane protein OmpA-like peptidoglycan-associated protein
VSRQRLRIAPTASARRNAQRRAEAVYHALLSRGVDSGRIQAVGRGMQLPVATNATAEGRQRNRRVELIFSNEQGQFASIGPPSG